MLAKLEFDLPKPSDYQEYETMLKAFDLLSALKELQQAIIYPKREPNYLEIRRTMVGVLDFYRIDLGKLS